MTYTMILIACFFSTFQAENNNNEKQTLRATNQIQLDSSEMQDLLRDGITQLEKAEQRKGRSQIG